MMIDLIWIKYDSERVKKYWLARDGVFSGEAKKDSALQVFFEIYFSSYIVRLSSRRVED